MMAIDIGDTAPDVVLADNDRKPKALSEFRGKHVVLAFMPGAFTGVCTRESCTFRDDAGQMERLNAQVVGVTVDPPASQKAWAEQNSFGFPVLSDYARKAVTAFGVAVQDWGGMEGYVGAKRSVFIIDRDGVVRYRWITVANEEPDYAEIQQVLGRLAARS